MSTANAQEQERPTADAQKYFVTGSDTILKIFVNFSSNSACYIFHQYIVLEFAGVDADDQKLVVRKRIDSKDLNCSLPEKEQQLSIIEGGGLFGLHRHFIFTDSGTGPDGRIITIYDIEKKKMVYSSVYSPAGNPSIKDNALIFYKDLTELKHKRHCPDAEKWLYESSLDYGFEQKTKVNLDTLLEKGIGKITCSQRQ